MATTPDVAWEVWNKLIDRLPDLSATLLATGPAAILLITLVVAERIVRSYVTSGNQALRRRGDQLIVPIWIFLGFMSAVVVGVYIYNITRGYSLLRGEIKLSERSTFDVSVSMDQAFGYSTSEKRGVFWAIYVDRPLSPHDYFEVIVQRRNQHIPDDDVCLKARDARAACEEKHTYIVRVSINQLQMASRSAAVIHIDVAKDHARLTHAGNALPLILCAQNDTRCDANINAAEKKEPGKRGDAKPKEGKSGFLRFSLVTSAFAQADLDESYFRDALNAEDVKIRREARIELARKEAAAIPFVEKILLDKGSSYRLQVGVLVALTLMSERSVELRHEAIARIVALLQHDDATMNEYARAVLRKKPTDQITLMIDAEIAKLAPEGCDKLGGNGSQISANLIRLAFARMEVGYDRGVWFNHGRSDEEFDQALRFRNCVPKEQQFQFALITYGRIGSHHRRAWDREQTTNQERIVRLRALEQHAKAFLDETRGKPYRYKHQIQDIERCRRISFDQWCLGK